VITQFENRQSMRWKFILGTASAALLAFAPGANAQGYPAKPIRLIVPFSPGGPTDILARFVGQKLTEAFGQQVLVENRPGAGTVIGTELVAKAAPDGYTLLMASTSTATIPSLLSKLPYDTLRDFTPVILLVASPNVLVVHPSLPAKSVRELIAIARSRPGQVVYGSGGNGTSAHLGAEILRLMAGVSMVHVPYKGAGPLTVGLISGEVSWMFGTIAPTLPHIQSGRLRPIAVSSARRASVLPEVPPVADTLPGFEASPWTGVSAPAATPKEVIARLNQEIAKALTTPETRERMAREGTDVVAGTPEQFDAFFRAQIEKWAKVIKAAGIKFE
jgi:tripartite-type tricarboxylate transporter receptor subunit TctC